MANSGESKSESDESKLSEDDPEKPNPESSAQASIPVYKNATEYAAAVNQWLWQCYYLQWANVTFPYYLFLLVTSNGQTLPDFTKLSNIGLNINNGTSQNTVPQVNGQATSVGTAVTNVPTLGQNQERLGSEYIIPPVWKRFLAETIDFFILLVLKLMVTYVAADYFGLIDINKYELDWLWDERVGYRAALQMTSEIITLEIIHRFVVCLFEALCLRQGSTGIGGATPGKSIMGIKVIFCMNIVQLDNNIVRIIPGSDMGFGWALLRAVIKNFSLAFFFPACFTIFFFQHSRAAYDIMCNCIVVQDPPPRQA